MFYNPTRKRTNKRMLSPNDYEPEQKKMNEANVEETWGNSVLQALKERLRWSVAAF